MMSMDTAARALDAMLHQGYAEERDGGVWLDDLAARYVADLAGEVQEATWRAQGAEEAQKIAERTLASAEDQLLKYDRIVRAVTTCFDSEEDDADVLAAIGDVLELSRAWPVLK